MVVWPFTFCVTTPVGATSTSNLIQVLFGSAANFELMQCVVISLPSITTLVPGEHMLPLNLCCHREAVVHGHRLGILREDHHARVGDRPVRRVGRMLVREAIFEPQAIGLEWFLVEQMAEALLESVVLVVRYGDGAVLHAERV